MSAGSARSIEVPGVVDVKYHGGMLYCMTTDPAGLIRAVNLTDGTEVASFLHMGNGPLEVLGPVPFGTMRFFESGGELYADLFNLKKQILRINFSRSVSTGVVEGSEIASVPLELLGKGVLSCVGEDMYVFRQPSDDMRQVSRGVWKEGKIHYTKAQLQLNRASLEKPDGYLFNLLFTSIQYHPSLRRFVETSSMLNTIHLYDWSGSFGRTISINRPADNIETAEKKGMENVRNVFQSVVGFPDFFAALYIDDLLQKPTGKKPELLFFDWDGTPLSRICLPFSATSFDYDPGQGKLFVVDQETERVYILDDGKVRIGGPVSP